MSTPKNLLSAIAADYDYPGRHNGVNLTANPKMNWLDYHMNRNEIADNIRTYMMESHKQNKFDPLKIRLRQILQRGTAQIPYSLVYHRLAEARTRLFVGSQVMKAPTKFDDQIKLKEPRASVEAVLDIQSVHSSNSTSWEHIQTGDLAADGHKRNSSGGKRVYQGVSFTKAPSLNSLSRDIVQNPPQYEQGEWKPNYDFVTDCNDIDEEEQRNGFYSWLNKLPTKRTIIDISSEAFANGTAVPDGHSGFTVSNIHHPVTPRDMLDNQTSLHWHETSSGYAYNMRNLLYKIKYAESVKENRPYSHVPYLRFVRSEDMEQLTTILLTQAIDKPAGSIGPCLLFVEKILSHCSKADLPFIVAVNPVRSSPDPMSPPTAKEEVMGYAYVKPCAGNDRTLTSKLMGQMEVFVVQEHRRKHVGQSLVDMIFILCGRNYTRIPLNQVACKWHGINDLADAQLKTNRLDKIVCNIAYLSPTEETTKWVTRWLTQVFKFKELDLVPLAEPQSPPVNW